MYYRTIGNTGMVTSIFGFGFWATFGVKSGLLDKEGIEQAKKILRIARNGGYVVFELRVCVWSFGRAFVCGQQ